MALRNRFLLSPRRLSSPPDAFRREEIFGVKQLKLGELGVDSHGSNEEKDSSQRDMEFYPKRMKIRRSHSEENLYSWDALEYEEAKNKFDGIYTVS